MPLEIYSVLQWSKVLSVQASFLKIWLEINWYNLQVALILQTFDACFKMTQDTLYLIIFSQHQNENTVTNQFSNSLILQQHYVKSSGIPKEQLWASEILIRLAKGKMKFQYLFPCKLIYYHTHWICNLCWIPVHKSILYLYYNSFNMI